MVKTYFTFGTASHFPYGIKDYVVIEALTQSHAEKEFLKRFPGNDPKCLNCAFTYSEEEWIAEQMQKRYYPNTAPAEYIVTNPTRDDIRDLVENFVYTSSNAFVLGTALNNAFPIKGNALSDIVNKIHQCKLNNVDLIMDELERYGYFNQIEKEPSKEEAFLQYPELEER